MYIGNRGGIEGLLLPNEVCRVPCLNVVVDDLDELRNYDRFVVINSAAWLLPYVSQARTETTNKSVINQAKLT